MRISVRGQIMIPKKLRQMFGLSTNVEVEITPTDRGLLIRKRSQGEHPVDRVYGILHRPSNTDDLIEDIRGR